MRERPAGDLLSIGEVARRSGVAASALRFYEEKGLIRSVREGAGRRRRFRRADLRRIAFVVFSQHAGMSLDEIRDALDRLPEGRIPEGKDWAKLTARWTRRIDERIALLERLRESLTGCIGCGCLSLARCRLANPGDRVAGRGPGPRFWVDPDAT